MGIGACCVYQCAHPMCSHGVACLCMYLCACVPVCVCKCLHAFAGSLFAQKAELPIRVPFCTLRLADAPMLLLSSLSARATLSFRGERLGVLQTRRPGYHDDRRTQIRWEDMSNLISQARRPSRSPAAFTM